MTHICTWEREVNTYYYYYHYDYFLQETMVKVTTHVRYSMKQTVVTATLMLSYVK